jgi:predicted nucleotidyltransferase
MTELSLLANQVGASERTLRRAVSEGTIRGTRPSPRRLKLSATEKEYVLRRWGLLAQLRMAFRTEPSVRFALLFGSTARGDDSDDSDIDLLIQAKDPSLVRRVDLELKLEGLLGRAVETVDLEDAADSPLLLADAAREGRVIVDRDQIWPGFSAESEDLQRRADVEYRSRKRRAFAGIDELLSKS